MGEAGLLGFCFVALFSFRRIPTPNIYVSQLGQKVDSSGSIIGMIAPSNKLNHKDF